jgi:ribose 5-phosphate isomerase
MGITNTVIRDTTGVVATDTSDGTVTGTVTCVSSSETQTTVGAAGGASALPATPTKYIKVTIDGTDYVFPAYAVS